MAIDNFPEILVFNTRDQEVADYLRDYLLMAPDSDVTEGTQPWIDANVFAAQMALIYFDAIKTADGVSLSNRAGAYLEDYAASIGLTPSTHLDAAGATGFVVMTGVSAGGTILSAGDILKSASGLQFKVVIGGTFANGQLCAIQAVDVGPQTNLAAGTQLKFSQQRPGSPATVPVYQQRDGSGLANGRDKESDDQMVIRIEKFQSNRPASGNDAEIQSVVENIPGFGVQKAFTYPAVTGPGMTCVVVMMQPSRIGASRIPDGAQQSIIGSALGLAFPADFGILQGLPVAQNTDLRLQIRWTPGASGWADFAPWPAYVSSPALIVSATSATVFRVNGSGQPLAPVIGQTIAVWDRANLTMRRKKLLTVTLVTTGIWDVTCDPVNNASDTSYVPQAGDFISPWSDSIGPPINSSGLNDVIGAVVNYFDNLGPGEQVATLTDQGQHRQWRNPLDPTAYPSTLTNKVLDPIDALPNVVAATVVSPTIPWSPAVGTPGVLSSFLALHQFAIYAL